MNLREIFFERAPLENDLTALAGLSELTHTRTSSDEPPELLAALKFADEVLRWRFRQTIELDPAGNTAGFDRYAALSEFDIEL